MATIKSFGDLEQSRKLAEILPLESADMCYSNDGTAIKIDANPYTVRYSMWKDCVVEIIPCWSLAALRNLLPTAIRPNKDLYLFESHNTFDNSWVYRYYNENDTSYLYCKNTNEVDACYEMILKLHELKML